jgi:DNA modification methylase
MFANPKQRSDRTEGALPFYEYYAGFSRSFVRGAIEQIGVSPGATILDSWNGAGTTTEAGVAAGLSVHGYDINPVMVLVAKARLLTDSVLGSIEPICGDILRKAARQITRTTHGEPLGAWLSPATAAAVRAIELSIQRLLVNTRKYQLIADLSTLKDLSSLAAFYYTALFKTLRQLLAPLRGSNPTWFKQKSPTPQLQISTSAIHDIFRHEVRQLAASLNAGVTINQQITASLDTSSSITLPLSDRSIDAVITSPPYCTRLDYAIATLPELALIGADHAILRNLRDSMIGSPTVSSATPHTLTAWGPTCAKFLEQIQAHPSKASAGYYLKTFLSYFDKIDRSFAELARVMRPSAPAVIVVQDSYYKDVHNDLATTLSEIAEIQGFILSHRDDFLIGTSLRSINSRSRTYRKSCSVVESVLLFRRQAPNTER